MLESGELESERESDENADDESEMESAPVLDMPDDSDEPSCPDELGAPELDSEMDTELGSAADPVLDPELGSELDERLDIVVLATAICGAPPVDELEPLNVALTPCKGSSTIGALKPEQSQNSLSNDVVPFIAPGEHTQLSKSSTNVITDAHSLALVR